MNVPVLGFLKKEQKKEKCRYCLNDVNENEMTFTDAQNKCRMCTVCAFVVAVAKYGNVPNDGVILDKKGCFSEENLPYELRKIRRKYVKAIEKYKKTGDKSVIENVQREYLSEQLDKRDKLNAERVCLVDSCQFDALASGKRRFLFVPAVDEKFDLHYQNGEKATIQDEKTGARLTVSIRNQKKIITKHTYIGGNGEVVCYYIGVQ